LKSFSKRKKQTNFVEKLSKTKTSSTFRFSAVPPKPAGDIVTVHLLSRGANAVLQAVENLTGGENVSIATSELTSIIDKKHDRKIDDDIDEAIWEEMETGLRHQGHVTPNYLALMALGGGIASIGLINESTP